MPIHVLHFPYSSRWRASFYETGVIIHKTYQSWVSCHNTNVVRSLTCKLRQQWASQSSSGLCQTFAMINTYPGCWYRGLVLSHFTSVSSYSCRFHCPDSKLVMAWQGQIASVGWAICGFGNVLSPVHHQAIKLTNADLLSIGPLEQKCYWTESTFDSRKFS